MKITKKMMDEKLLQIAEFEKRWGENTHTKAMKKYCTDEKYRNNANEFTRTAKNLMVGYEKYK
tara:strand:- start:211 stop:399 length:189 start_codon:yes stop_codon:yes gene_type:complete